MSDSVLLEVAKQIPFAVILFAVIVVFLNHLQKEAAAVRTHDKEMETLRITAAKERESERRLHESEMSNFWAVTIKNMNDQQTQALQAIAKMIADHEEADKTRYENMHITKDLLEVAKETLKKR
jgi:hypothetical protein